MWQGEIEEVSNGMTGAPKWRNQAGSPIRYVAVGRSDQVFEKSSKNLPFRNILRHSEVSVCLSWVWFSCEQYNGHLMTQR